MARAEHLAGAFRARGIRPLTVSLAACGFSTATRTGLSIPGLGDRLPKGALVLFVPGGSFEQVTTYLGVLHGLRELGVTVWNDAPRHRALRRQIHHHLLPATRRHSNALDLDRANRDEAARSPRPSSPKATGSCRSRCSARKAKACG